MANGNEGALWRLINLQPAVWRGLVVAVLAIAGTAGLDVAVDLPDNVMLVVIGILPILQALYTKGAVTPNAKVAVRVPDPVNAPEEIEAGPAVPLDVSTQDILAATYKEGE